MKKIIGIIAAGLLATAALAQTTITKVDKISPTDEVFMDMAVTAAKTASEQGLKPCGAVVILNGAWRSTGMPSDTQTAEEAAIAKSRRTKLTNASIYTINQPTSEAINAIRRAGAEEIFFVNPAAEVIAAGIYPAEAYDEAKLDTTLAPVPMQQMDYAPASKLIKK